jgi:hypothetical protein
MATKRGWSKLDKALRKLPPLDVDKREKCAEELARDRHLGRQNIHGGEARLRILQQLIERLTEEHDIADRGALADAIDTAALIYRDGRAALDQKDKDRLLAAIPKVTEVLSREGNDRRIAQILTDRDMRDMSGKLWHRGKHVTAMQVDTIERVWQIAANLDQLEAALRAQGKRQSDIGLHRTTRSLERYWKSSLGRKLALVWVSKGRGTKGQYPKSEAARFVEAVIGFIAPLDVPKLPSVARHRLRRLAK